MAVSQQDVAVGATKRCWMSSVNRFAARGWLTGDDGGTAVLVQQYAHARARTHTRFTLSETRYCNLLLLALHVPYNKAFPGVFHFDCIFSWIHSTPPSIPLPWHRCAQIFLEPSNHLKILGARKETWSKLRTVDQNILGANVHSSVARIRAPLFWDLVSDLCSQKQHVGHPACPFTGDYKGEVYPRTGHEEPKGE